MLGLWEFVGMLCSLGCVGYCSFLYGFGSFHDLNFLCYFDVFVCYFLCIGIFFGFVLGEAGRPSSF